MEKKSKESKIHNFLKELQELSNEHGVYIHPTYDGAFLIEKDNKTGEYDYGNGSVLALSSYKYSSEDGGL